MKDDFFKDFVLFCLVIILCLCSLPFSFALCDSSNTPNLRVPSYFELREDELFEYDITPANMPDDGVYYSYLKLKGGITGLVLTDIGILRVLPGREDGRESIVAVLALKDDCVSTALIKLNVLTKPVIKELFPWSEEFGINKSTSQLFKLVAESDNSGANLRVSWLIDSKPVSVFGDYPIGNYSLDNDSLSNLAYSDYYFNFSAADISLDGIEPNNITLFFGEKSIGLHNITAIVKDSYNLTKSQSWMVDVVKQNRPPVLINELPGFVLFNSTASTAFNLNDYFKDPDNSKLKFSYKLLMPSLSEPILSVPNISVSIGFDGSVTYDPADNARGYAYFIFTAYDLFNLSAESNNARVDVIDKLVLKKINGSEQDSTCGDGICGLKENCSICPYDCGKCDEQFTQGCQPSWACSEWSACQPQGFALRNCTDTSQCGDNRTKPIEIKVCEYNASCSDGLKNGVEAGVDCGGPCDACPNCTDNIQNQGEAGVDCGGPCDACPDCFDNIKNQNESDIDCGGVCAKCSGNKSCFYSLDCESLDCKNRVCTFASCADQIRNQGEAGVDCGGPCAKPCGNCSDGVQNQGEAGVDCGGKCRPCPSCFDGIKNGLEKYTDCGGSCRSCALGDFIKSNLMVSIVILVLLIAFIVFIFLFVFLVLAKPENAKRIYNSNFLFSMLLSLNRFTRGIRKAERAEPAVRPDLVNNYLSTLVELAKRNNYAAVELHETIKGIYISMLGLPEGFDERIFFLKARESRIPPFLRVLLAGFYKKSEILVKSSYIPDEEKEQLITEIRFLLFELKKG